MFISNIHSKMYKGKWFQEELNEFSLCFDKFLILLASVLVWEKKNKIKRGEI